MALIDNTREILGDLVGFATVSADSNLDLIAYAAERLSECGASIHIQRDETGAKANLFATIGPETDGGIVLSGHTDVVPADETEWTSDPFQLRENDGLLYGRGTCDMKGFIAAALAVAPAFAAHELKKPVHFAFTFDEEVGCLGARQLVDYLKDADFRPSSVIVGEPTGMGIIEGHKGCCEYTTEFFGMEGHGSNPDAGVNAVEYAVRYISRLMEIGEGLKREPGLDSSFVPPWTTVQVGKIEGGSARNVIAGQCAVEWEIRPVRPGDAERIKADLAAYCEEVLLPAMQRVSSDSRIETHTIGEVEGLHPVSENDARSIVAELTGANAFDLVSFGTEAGLFQGLGMSVVVCGPGSIEQAHKPDEFVSIPQLQSCLEMLTGLQARLRRQGN